MESWAMEVVLLYSLLFLVVGDVAEGTRNGVNLQPSYYNGGNVTFGWDLMLSYSQIQSVRIEIEPDSLEMSQTWIREAKKMGYHVIATYHKYASLGSDDPHELYAAAEWWRENYSFLSVAGEFDINIMNEWGSHDLTPQAYADSYNHAISMIRAVYDGPLIIDIPGWGQEADVAAAASSSLLDKNLIYSAHIYPQSYNQAAGRYFNEEDINTLSATKRRCIIGEFGDIYDFGNVKTDRKNNVQEKNECDVAEVVQAAKSSGFQGVYGWAWNGDGGTLNMVQPAWTKNATAGDYSETPYFWSIMALL